MWQPCIIYIYIYIYVDRSMYCKIGASLVFQGLGFGVQGLRFRVKVLVGFRV